jgi:UDP-3-O-[3-hydroxymyristoyl] glucosamine N-acyltransferase
VLVLLLNPRVKIDVGCIINTRAIIEQDCYIGKFSRIVPGAVLLDMYQLEGEVL